MDATFPLNKTVYVSCDEKTLCNHPDCIAVTDHEEADTRIFLHLKDALAKGFQYIGIQSLDTDVFVIMLGHIHQLEATYNFTDIVLESHRKKESGQVGMKSLVERLWHAFCQSVPFLHCISGTDTTSAFCGIGKKKALGAMKAFSEATRVFGSLFSLHFNP